MSFQTTTALRIFNNRRRLASLFFAVVFVPQWHALPPYCINMRYKRWRRVRNVPVRICQIPEILLVRHFLNRAQSLTQPRRPTIFRTRHLYLGVPQPVNQILQNPLKPPHTLIHPHLIPALRLHLRQLRLRQLQLQLAHPLRPVLVVVATLLRLVHHRAAFLAIRDFKLQVASHCHSRSSVLPLFKYIIVGQPIRTITFPCRKE